VGFVLFTSPAIHCCEEQKLRSAYASPRSSDDPPSRRREKALAGSRVSAAEQVPHPRRSGYRNEGWQPQAEGNFSGAVTGAGFGMAFREGGNL